jgi:adenylate kinase
MKRRVVLLGPPGSGKGTVAEMLEKRFNLEHVSSGHWFRREIDAGTPLGKRVGEYVVRGELVPDELVLGLIQHWLTPNLMEHGYLLDGFPRTLPQAEALDRFCAEKKAPLDVVLYLDCPKEVIVERITGRRVCPTCGKGYHMRTLPPRLPGICDVCGAQLVQRPDDTEEIVGNRLEFYRQVTEPLVDYYRKTDKLVSLNAALSSDAAFALALPVLES